MLTLNKHETQSGSEEAKATGETHFQNDACISGCIHFPAGVKAGPKFSSAGPSIFEWYGKTTISGAVDLANEAEESKV